MDGRCSVGRCNNQRNDGVGGGEAVGRGDADEQNVWGRTFPCRFRRRVEGQKIKIERAMGPQNNQPKNGRIVGLYYREPACTAMTIGEDTAASFWPSDSRQRNKYNKICCCLRQSQINNRMQQPTKLTRKRWVRDGRGRATMGERRGGRHSIGLGAIKLGGGSVIGHGILAGSSLANCRGSLK